MATTNLDQNDQRTAQTGGVVREEVLNRIFDHSKIRLEFLSRVGTGSTGNQYVSWLMDEYGTPDTDNAHVDGADLDQNDTTLEERVGNYTQTMAKVVRVSTLANEANTIGYRRALSRNILRRQEDLRRDLNATVYINQASVADNGNATPGRFGTLPSWLTTNVSAGATAVAGGFTHGAGNEGVVAARTPGTARALTQTIFDDVLESIYENNGNPSIAFMRPKVKRAFGTYLLSETAQVAQLWSEQGKTAQRATAANSVSIYIDQYDNAIELCPDRLQTTTGTDRSDILICSPEYLTTIYHYGWRTEQQGRTGLSDKYQLHSNMTLGVLSEKAHGAVFDVLETAAVTA